jgi:hypothetical protein
MCAHAYSAHFSRYMHWKIIAATFSVKIHLNTRFNQNNLNTFGEKTYIWRPGEA